MGQKLSCRENHETALFSAVQTGDLVMVQAMVEAEPNTLKRTTRYGKSSILHVAAIYGQIEVLSFLLDRCPNSDILNRHRQTPLMLAAMHGKTDCVKMLIQRGAYVLMFDSLQGRTCLHYVAYYGHFDCLQALLSAARSSPLADSWGFVRFVNIRDENGATPLHLAARQGWSNCVHALLDNGALVCASTGGNGYPGSTPLHFAASGGSIECIRKLLAWGADRLQPDSYGRIPYLIALKHKHEACAALLDPASAEPLVWPLPLRFISDLNPEAKELLEKALMEANRERENVILQDTIHALPSASDSEVEADHDTASEASDVDVCCICFDQLCTIEIRQCGHRMCAHCTLALCCHKKPNPLTSSPVVPICPFCRRGITQLAVAKINNNEAEAAEASPLRLSCGNITNNDTGPEFSPSKPIKSRKSNFSEGSSSLKGLSAISSFGKMGSRCRKSAS
ncbi:putative E3 ubiquitin-protein ligase XBAT31 [Herrania umbratica]|uniref:RING-type E3 ubiquitin transferase n=1 Tax=Herrania umbratica TaxID=108875 RepID=A0A6J1ATK5_9ROSI|nr:putative E3 ubiquitin-protein ligase XBAT31 [Herrania umbratica]